MIQHCIASYGQSNVGSNIDADLSLLSNLKVYPLKNFDTRNRSFIGSALLFNNWQLAHIQLVKRDDYLKDLYLINYDLSDNVFIIKYNNKIFTFPINYVQNIRIDGRGNRVENYTIIRDENNLQMLFKEVVGGEIQLLSKTIIKIVRSNYNIALDAGNIRPKIVRHEKWYIAKDGKILELPKKLKHLKYNLETLSSVTNFLINQKINLKDEAELESAILNLNNKLEYYEINK